MHIPWHSVQGLLWAWFKFCFQRCLRFNFRDHKTIPKPGIFFIPFSNKTLLLKKKVSDFLCCPLLQQRGLSEGTLACAFGGCLTLQAPCRCAGDKAAQGLTPLLPVRNHAPLDQPKVSVLLLQKGLSCCLHHHPVPQPFIQPEVYIPPPQWNQNNTLDSYWHSTNTALFSTWLQLVGRAGRTGWHTRSPTHLSHPSLSISHSVSIHQSLSIRHSEVIQQLPYCSEDNDSVLACRQG